jgi:hypothetical protein
MVANGEVSILPELPAADPGQPTIRNFTIGGDSPRVDICSCAGHLSPLSDQVARVDLCQCQMPRSKEKNQPLHAPSKRKLSTKHAH